MNVQEIRYFLFLLAVDKLRSRIPDAIHTRLLQIGLRENEVPPKPRTRLIITSHPSFTEERKRRQEMVFKHPYPSFKKREKTQPKTPPEPGAQF